MLNPLGRRDSAAGDAQIFSFGTTQTSGENLKFKRLVIFGDHPLRIECMRKRKKEEKFGRILRTFANSSKTREAFFFFFSYCF